VTAVITLGWALALVVVLAIRSVLHTDVRWWVWTCVAGLVMGLFGLWYVPFLKRRRERIAAAHAAHSPLAHDPLAQAQLSEPASGYVSRDNGSNTVSSTETPGKSTRS
jgi:ABC-type nickel/cobalt efflux system permease component RcnA